MTALRDLPYRLVARPFLTFEAAVFSYKARFVLRTIAAMGIALFAALALQLPSPASAAVTVLIVSNTSRGGLLAKGLWRIFGTLTGAIAAVIMFSIFGQAPLLLVVAFSGWLAICCFLSAMLRHFRSYAAVLSGYTVAIVAAGAFSNPADVLQDALARLSVVTIGVVVSTFVAMVFQKETTVTTLRSNCRQSFKGVMQLILAFTKEDDEKIWKNEQARLIAMMDRLDEAVEFSGMEAQDIYRHAGSLRKAIAALYSLLLASPIIGEALVTLKGAAVQADGPRESADAMLAFLRRARDLEPESLESLIRLNADAKAMLALLSQANTSGWSPDEMAAHARLYDAVERIDATVSPFVAWRKGDAPLHRRTDFKAFMDYRSARRNAARAFIACIATGIAWYITTWTGGPAVLIIVASISALLSAAPSAAGAAFDFTKGAILAAIVSYAIEFEILPHVSGFLWLWLVASVPVAVGLYVGLKPKWNALTFGFNVLLLSSLGIQNVMGFNVITHFDAGLSDIVGGFCTLLIFRVLIPPNPAQDVLYLKNRLHKTLLDSLGQRNTSHADWLTGLIPLNQAVQRLLQRTQQASPDQKSDTIKQCGALLMLANHSRSLKRLVPASGDGPLSARSFGAAVRKSGTSQQSSDEWANAFLAEARKTCPHGASYQMAAAHAWSISGLFPLAYPHPAAKNLQ